MSDANAPIKENFEAAVSLINPVRKVKKGEEVLENVRNWEKVIEETYDIANNSQKAKDAKTTQKEIDQLGEYVKKHDKGTGKTVDDLIGGAKPLQEKKSTIYPKTGGYNEALKDFEALNPINIKPPIDKKTGLEIGKRGQINLNGNMVDINVRSKSSGNEPTIEIIEGKYDRIKFRY